MIEYNPIFKLCKYIATSFQLAVDIIEVAKTCIVYNTQ